MYSREYVSYSRIGTDKIISKCDVQRLLGASMKNLKLVKERGDDYMTTVIAV